MRPHGKSSDVEERLEPFSVVGGTAFPCALLPFNPCYSETHSLKSRPIATSICENMQCSRMSKQSAIVGQTQRRASVFGHLSGEATVDRLSETLIYSTQYIVQWPSVASGSFFLPLSLVMRYLDRFPDISEAAARGPRTRHVRPPPGCYIYRVAPKSKPLPTYQKIVLNSTKACHWD